MHLTGGTAGPSTRDRLIEAAISILETEGESGIRVERVAALAGFTKPVLYHHLGDREGVIAAAQAVRFQRSLEAGLGAVAELIEASSSAEEFLAAMRAMLRTFTEPAGHERRRFRIEVLGASASRPELRASIVAAGRAYIDRFEMPLRLAEARGWLRPVVPIRDLAQWWVGLILGRHVFEIDPDGFDLASWDAVTDSVLRFMILGEGGPTSDATG